MKTNPYMHPKALDGFQSSGVFPCRISQNRFFGVYPYILSVAELKCEFEPILGVEIDSVEYPC